MPFEGKSKIKTWIKLERHTDKRFILATYMQELYLRVTSLQHEASKLSNT